MQTFSSLSAAIASREPTKPVGPEESDSDEETVNKEQKTEKGGKRDRILQRENKKLAKLTQEEQALENARTVFVGNVERSTTQKEIQKLFSKAGKVDSVRLRSVYVGKQNISKRVALLGGVTNQNVTTVHYYVKFAEPEATDEAVKLFDGYKLKDHNLRVEKLNASTAYSEKNTVFVGNLPFSILEAAVQKHFDDAKVGEVKYVRLVRDSHCGLGKGFGFVVFVHPAAVKKALELDGTKLDGRNIRVTRLKNKDQVQVDSQKHTQAKKNATKEADVSRILTSNRTTKEGPKKVYKPKGVKKIKKKKAGRSLMG